MMPQDDRDEHAYVVLGARMNNWYQLLWQVPLFAFTAQAFTFTIALTPNMSEFGRVVACVLSLVISFGSLFSIARQRKADFVDAHALAEIEKRWEWPNDERLYGPIWSARRQEQSVNPKWVYSLLGRLPLTGVWMVAFLILIVLAVAIIVCTIAMPAWLS